MVNVSQNYLTYNKNNQADVVVVLGNLMNSAGELNAETKLRADKAFEIYKNQQARAILTCGWAYRPDCRLTIADAVRLYLISKHGVCEKFILTQDKSRDTVGDAYFTRVLYIEPMMCKSIIVVTSNYHVDRVREIFNFIFFGISTVNVVGVGIFTKDAAEAEKKSLNTFREMFYGVMAGNIESIYQRLTQMHPYYNGKIYEKI